MRSMRVLVGAVVVTLVAAACASPPEGSGAESAQGATGTTAGVGATTTTESPNVTVETTTTTKLAVETTTATTIEEAKPGVGVARVPPDLKRGPIPSFQSGFATPVGPTGEGGDAWALTLSRDGDYEWTDVATGEAAALYDARTLTSVFQDEDIVLIRTGTIIGGPDSPVPFLWHHRLFQSIASRAIEDGSGTYADIGGSLSVEIRETWDPARDVEGMIERVFAVDVETGLMTKLETIYMYPELNYSSVGGVTTGILRDEASFTSSKPPSVPKRHSDMEPFRDRGFIPVGSLDEASKLAGYAVPPPGFVPEGFELTQVAYGADPSSYIWGENIVALTYMKAGWIFTVTYRDKTFEGNPFVPPGFGYEDIAVTHGAFTLVPAANTVTHAYGTIGGLFITVDGGIGLETLKKIVDGLG